MADKPTKERGFSRFPELLGGSYTKNPLTEDVSASSKGVHAEQSAASRKYGRGAATLARLVIPVGDEHRDALLSYFKYDEALLDIASKIFGSNGLAYIDFLLQSAQEAYSEKVQLVDTLSDNYVAYFFGQSPPVFRYSGLLFNTWQDDWRSAFYLAYEEILRGTKLARRNVLLNLQYDQQIVVGYMLDHTQMLSSDTQMAAQFSFSMLVKNMRVYRLPGSISTPITPAGEDRMSFKLSPNVGGIYISPVRRTMRQVGAPVVQEETRAKESNQNPEQKSKLPDLKPADKTPAQEQQDVNIKGGTSAVKSS